MKTDPAALIVFLFFFILITVMGFAAARWRRPQTLARLDEMKRNANGSVTLSVGPNPPQGLTRELDSHAGQTTDADNALLRSGGRIE